ncbi:hypothetical protein [Dokdonella sp.]|uniref:hypothetical protein n=1 Tax=Dokdonella sp. TaxID=2291710 RepID=UPI0031BC7607|nr:hypothetical protein [Dokdonella sp.]
MKATNCLIASFAVASILGPCIAMAQTLGASGPRVIEQLPRIECDRFDCTFTQPTLSSNSHLAAIPPTGGDLLPLVAAPPTGQRLLWRGPGAGTNFYSCQELPVDGSLTYTSPYEYVKGTSVKVPLGSTHISIEATVQGGLRGGATGAAGMVGMLEVRRATSGTWEIADYGYIYTTPGYSIGIAQALYGKTTFTGLMDLSTLGGVSGVPEEIDVRLAVYNIRVGGFALTLNEVCYGSLIVSF